MNSSDDLPMGESMESFAAKVRDTAYFLWEQDGKPEGKSDEYWYRALDMCIRTHVSDQALENNAPDEPVNKE